MLNTLRRFEKLGFIFVALPPLIYWMYWTLNPSYWFNADPAAVYFVDSLSIFAGNSYKFVDHPGTPVHLIGSFLLALTYPFFDNQEAFINFHLARPGAFFLMVNSFLLLANLLCVFVFYKIAVTTLEHDQMLGGIALALSYFVLHPYSFPSLTFWSHNSFNFPFGTLWLLWLYSELRKDEEIRQPILLFMGLTAGILAAAQMYFIVWLISGVFTIFVFSVRLNKTFKQAVLSGIYMLAGGVFGFLMMLLPVYKELPRFAGWLTQIITHQGLYGTGESGIYTLAMIPASIRYWWATIPLMMLILLFTSMALGIFAVWNQKSSTKIPPGTFAMIIGLLFQTGLILFVMSKAVLRLRFSLSLAALLPVLILLVLKLSEMTSWRGNKLNRLFYAAILIGVIVSLTQQIGLQQRRAVAEREAPLAKEQAVTRLAQKTGVTEEDIVVVYAFSVPLKCPGLLLARNWTGSFDKEITSICPNQYAILDVNEGLNAEFNTVRPIPDIKEIDWDLVVWPGNGSNLPEYLYSVGAINIPNSWHVRRDKWFFIHSIDEE
ncbi:MAG: hypothetical protein L0287_21825 [Anaerolineae bacterium]|nr:hypothetical protein [Anaerolineae bacterium]MCI0607780.1 hypothetical protein [Anaerolineae bacterium]